MVFRAMRYNEMTWKVIVEREKKRCESRVLTGGR